MSKRWLRRVASDLRAGRVCHVTYSKALTDTLHLARRYRLSSYKASYLELALRGGLPIATLDAELTKAALKAGVRPFARR